MSRDEFSYGGGRAHGRSYAAAWQIAVAIRDGQSIKIMSTIPGHAEKMRQRALDIVEILDDVDERSELMRELGEFGGEEKEA